MPHPSPASIPLFHSPVPSTPPCNILWSLSKFETLFFFLETKPTCPNLKFKLPLLRAGRFRLKKNNIYKLSYFFSLTSYLLPLTLTHPTRTNKNARTNCKHANRRRDGRRPKRTHHGRRVGRWWCQRRWWYVSDQDFVCFTFTSLHFNSPLLPFFPSFLLSFFPSSLLPFFTLHLSTHMQTGVAMDVEELEAPDVNAGDDHFVYYFVMDGKQQRKKKRKRRKKQVKSLKQIKKEMVSKWICFSLTTL